MKDLTNPIQTLIEKLNLAKGIYEKASTTAHGDALITEMKDLVKKKEVYINDLNTQLNVNADDVSPSFAEAFKTSLEKGLMRFDDAMNRVNEGAIYKTCIEREDELVDAYSAVIADEKVYENSDEIKSLCKFQLNESESLLSQFKERSSEYNFDKDGK